MRLRLRTLLIELIFGLAFYVSGMTGALVGLAWSFYLNMPGWEAVLAVVFAGAVSGGSLWLYIRYGVIRGITAFFRTPAPGACSESGKPGGMVRRYGFQTLLLFAAVGPPALTWLIVNAAGIKFLLMETLAAFTIRDLLWMLLVVAIGLAWWCNHRRLSKRIKVLATRIHQSRN
jgi:hypothetical protein